MSSVDVDVVVVGGGVQGMLAVEEMQDRGYTVLGVTDGPLGTGQSAHTHGWTHHGFPFPDAHLQLRYRQGAELLGGKLDKAGYANKEGLCYISLPKPRAEQLLKYWDEAKQSYDEVTSLPEAIKGGMLESETFRTFKIADWTMDPIAVIKTLAKPVQELYVTGRVTGFTPSSKDASTIQSVSVVHPDGSKSSVSCRMVVLCVGSRLRQFLRRVTLPDPSLQDAVERSAKNLLNLKVVHMLCLAAPDGVLPNTGHLGAPGMIYATHVGAFKRDGKSYTLTYYTPTDPDSFAYGRDTWDKQDAQPSSEIVSTAVKRLFSAMPNLASLKDKVQWKVYVGYKQEHPQHEPAVARFYSGHVSPFANVLTSIPNLMTGAATCASSCIGMSETEIGAPRPVSVEARSKHVAAYIQKTGHAAGVVSKHFHESVAWQTWGEFAKAHGIA